MYYVIVLEKPKDEKKEPVEKVKTPPKFEDVTESTVRYIFVCFENLFLLITLSSYMK